MSTRTDGRPWSGKGAGDPKERLLLDLVREVALATAERIADTYGSLGVGRVWAERHQVADAIAADYRLMAAEESMPEHPFEQLLRPAPESATAERERLSTAALSDLEDALAAAPPERAADGERLELMAAAVHQAYLDTCARLGWSVKPENKAPYAELSEASKELDRASVRAVLALATAAEPAPDAREVLREWLEDGDLRFAEVARHGGLGQEWGALLGRHWMGERIIVSSGSGDTPEAALAAAAAALNGETADAR